MVTNTQEKPKQHTFYPSVDSSPDFVTMEEEVLAFWQKQHVFQASVDAKPSKDAAGENNEFIFYDGPPFANGLPHYGHLLTGYVKDIVARYQTQKGKRVERRFGWDCHGLPAEMGAEKDLGISGRMQITKFGIDKFNAQCRTSVMKYTSEWEYYVNRQGRWVDFSNDYKTMDINYMESVMWAFKELYNKGLTYESMRVMPYSWACETPLSNFETRLDNSYRERADKAVTVAFTLKEKPKGAPEAEVYKVLAWTTTPWTLPSNLALGVGKEIDYACVVVEQQEEVDPPLPVGEGWGEGLLSDHYNKKLKDYARDLRKNSTEVENILWQLLRNRQLLGAKFYRQRAIGNYIADFVCRELKLIIELDGGQHSERQHSDAKRTEFLQGVGYTVLRFWNNDVVENLEGVIETIHSELSQALTLTLSHRERGLEPEAQTVCYILAKNVAEHYAKALGLGEHWNTTNEESLKIDQENRGRLSNSIKGSELVGLSYEPLFPFFKDHPNSFKIFADEFIQEGDGTGIVHLAPGFGEDDQRVCADNGINVVCPVDNAGRFTDEIYDIEGLSLKGKHVIWDEPSSHKETGNEYVIRYLKEKKLLIGNPEQVLHNYPHCWRTDTPLIYKAVPSWYVEVTKFKDRMVELNQQINWIPGHIKDGLFGKWLENARDWSISRNRFWGAPIPVWKSDNPKNKELYVFGSIKELEDFFGKKVTDLHRPFIDELTKPDPLDPKYTLRRVEDVFDCWFESGSMPYGQAHYPFENKDWFETHFPADFIVEYTAQTRGWFYTLMVLSTALFDRPPFWNCICHGVVLDEKGQKLSKRLNNYADPKEIFALYGSDALRWLMVSSPVLRGGELLIDKECKMVRDVARLALRPIWNAYNFFTLYANADGIEAQFDKTSDHLMDRYILSKAKEAVHRVTQSMDNYDPPSACTAVEQFFEVLNNWYIRRSRQRFWKEAKDADKQAAYNTLYTVLHVMCRAAAPLLPFLTETIWLGLTAGSHSHLKGGVTAAASRGYNETTLGNAQALRKTPTDAEKKLWQYLRDGQLGYKFRRQQPIGQYIADFVCLEKKIIVEVDGGQHAENAKDKERTKYLEKAAYTVLRFWNNEVLHNIEGVVSVIQEKLAVAKNTPSPLEGEGWGGGLTHRFPESVTPPPNPLPQGEGEASASVHLADFPHSSNLPDAGGLTADMDRVRDVCNAALAVRNTQNIRVRQPLDRLDVLGSDVERLEAYADIIKEEVNVKHIGFSGDIGGRATFKLQVQFPIVGKRLPAKMKDIIAASKQGKWSDAGGDTIEVAGEILLPGEYAVLLEAKDPKATQALSTNDALVVLDLNVTEALKVEGIARDLVRLVQQSRKEADLHVSDRIALVIESDNADVQRAAELFSNHTDYSIADQTLAVSVSVGNAKSCKHAFTQDLEGSNVVIGFDIAA